MGEGTTLLDNCNDAPTKTGCISGLQGVQMVPLHGTDRCISIGVDVMEKPGPKAFGLIFVFFNSLNINHIKYKDDFLLEIYDAPRHGGFYLGSW